MRLACNARNMIGRPAAILGLVGDNFAAGMSGAMAYVGTRPTGSPSASTLKW